MLMPNDTQGKTHVAFLLDKSGSMISQKESIISLYREMIEAMRNNREIEFINHLWMFNEDWSYVFGPRSVREVKPITSDDYQPEGMTSLRDTLIHVIDNLRTVHHLNSSDSVIINILTDGEDTSSKHTIDECAYYVKEAERLGWQVVYLGERGKTETTAKDIGVRHVAYDNLEGATRTLTTSYSNYKGGNFSLD